MYLTNSGGLPNPITKCERDHKRKWSTPLNAPHRAIPREGEYEIGNREEKKQTFHHNGF